MCSFYSNDCVMLFSENKYDDDDDKVSVLSVMGTNRSQRVLDLENMMEWVIICCHILPNTYFRIGVREWIL